MNPAFDPHRRGVLLAAVAITACSPGGRTLAAADPYAASPWRKLADAGADPDLIRTVSGVGYAFGLQMHAPAGDEAMR